MPERRPNSRFYYVRRRRLPVYGDTGRISSRTTSKRVAQEMERMLEDFAYRALTDPSWYQLLDAICKTHTVTLPQALRAKNDGTLVQLKRSLSDPKLSEAVQAIEHLDDSGVTIGREMLLAYAPDDARLSYLTGATITRMCVQAEADDRKRNSVRRTLLRAISWLLRHHLGNAERNRIFSDVIFPAEKDGREVHLTPDEIARLLEACRQAGGQELATVVRTALQTSADRGVLLHGAHRSRTYRGLLVRDLTIFRDDRSATYFGRVELHDTKNEARPRTVPMTDGLCRELLALTVDKAPEDPVFSLTYAQLDYPWKAAREAAGLKHVRFKDLRHQSAQYGEQAGINLTVVSRAMGHSDERTTRRYQQHSVVMSQKEAEALERAMFETPKEGGKIRRVAG